MKKDADLQQMIDELWLLKKDELNMTKSRISHLKRQFTHPEISIQPFFADQVIANHSKLIRGVVINPNPQQKQTDAYRPWGNIRQGID